MLAELKQKIVGFVARHPKALALTGALAGIAPAVSAVTVDLNGTLGPLLDSIAALVPSIINLIVAMVPLFIIMAGLGLVFALIYVIIEIVEGLAHSFKGKWGRK